jgi:hypothetical protein
MQLRDQVRDSILPILDEALNEGFQVFVLRPSDVRIDPIGFAYVCLDTEGSFAVVNAGHNLFEEPSLTAPIKPNREYGSGVLVDYDGTTYGAIESLRAVCRSKDVTVRFMGRNRDGLGPTVLNFGRQVLDRWPGGPDRFVELTPANQTQKELISA